MSSNNKDEDHNPLLAPDLEEGQLSEAEAPSGTRAAGSSSYTPPPLSPQEKYPQANEKQSGLLVLLDDVIGNVMPKFEPPLLTIDPPVRALIEEIPTMAESLIVPAMALVATISGAFVMVAIDDPLAIAVYPYIAVFVTFLSTLRPLIARLAAAADVIMLLLDEFIEKIQSELEDVCANATSYVDQVENKLQDVLAPMKPKLDEASKAEVMLKKANPDVEIPDTGDLEEALAGLGDKIENKMVEFQSSLDLKSCIPKIFESKDVFTWRVIFPVVVVFFVIQVLVLHAQQGSIFDAIDEATSDDGGDVGPDDAESDEESFSDKLENNWDLFLTAIVAFLTSVGQLLLSFVLSQRWIGKSYVNLRILLASSSVSELSEEKVEPLFRDLLIVKMENIKSQMLKLIETMGKIENLMKKSKFSFFG